MTGTLSRAQRIDRIDMLAEAAEKASARRVLVATDCVSEGVNLCESFGAMRLGDDEALLALTGHRPSKRAWKNRR